MSIFTEHNSKRIDVVFVLLLLALFAAASFTLVLIGTKQYRFVTNTMSDNHEKRIISSYLSEKIRQNDTADSIDIVNLKGIDALSFSSEENGIAYTTYIYYYENALREIVVTPSSVFSLSSGQEIIALQDFSPEFASPSLIRVNITDTGGNDVILYFHLHCNAGKEAP